MKINKLPIYLVLLFACSVLANEDDPIEQDPIEQDSEWTSCSQDTSEISSPSTTEDPCPSVWISGDRKRSARIDRLERVRRNLMFDFQEEALQTAFPGAVIERVQPLERWADPLQDLELVCDDEFSLTETQGTAANLYYPFEQEISPFGLFNF